MTIKSKEVWRIHEEDSSRQQPRSIKFLPNETWERIKLDAKKPNLFQRRLYVSVNKVLRFSFDYYSGAHCHDKHVWTEAAKCAWQEWEEKREAQTEENLSSQSLFCSLWFSFSQKKKDFFLHFQKTNAFRSCVAIIFPENASEKEKKKEKKDIFGNKVLRYEPPVSC